jgi:hypothetical protein
MVDQGNSVEEKIKRKASQINYKRTSFIYEF